MGQSVFSQEVIDTICSRLADGESLRAICADDAMPGISTVMRWMSESPALREQYACAREAQADKMVEDILQIADDGLNDTYVDDNGNTRTDQDVIARSRLRVDARKWLASKMAPKKYGDKVELSGPGEGGAHVIQSITRRLIKPNEATD